MKEHILSLTPELVALCERTVADPGRHPKFTPVSGERLEILTDRLVRELGNEPLWLFAYGSLIWKPNFTFMEQRAGTLYGWHRSFCLELTTWRGSQEQPGLMMALERGGRCGGVAYRFPEEEQRLHLQRTVHREIPFVEHVDMVRWVPVRTSLGEIRALVFWAGPKGEGIAPRLPLERVAWVLARACGHGGSGAGYLYQTVSKLKEHGIHDRNLWKLQDLVAREIRNQHGLMPDAPAIAPGSTVAPTTD